MYVVPLNWTTFKKHLSICNLQIRLSLFEQINEENSFNGQTKSSCFFSCEHIHKWCSTFWVICDPQTPLKSHIIYVRSLNIILIKELYQPNIHNNFSQYWIMCLLKTPMKGSKHLSVTMWSKKAGAKVSRIGPCSLLMLTSSTLLWRTLTPICVHWKPYFCL